jgi:hypothetical protein
MSASAFQHREESAAVDKEDLILCDIAQQVAELKREISEESMRLWGFDPATPVTWEIEL